MGAVRVALNGGVEDVFADEVIGDSLDPRLTVFDYRFEVSPCRALTVTITQLFRDRRFSPHLEPVGCVEVAHYRPAEWLTVTKA
jgi:hypothetical protein